MIEIVNKSNFILYQNIFRDFQYKEYREKELIDKTILDIKKNRSIAYLLNVDKKYLGFIAISASRLKTDIDGIPAIEIDYLFIDKQYRKQEFKKLDDLKASIYLLNLIINNVSKELQKKLGLKVVILYPDKQNLNLINFYHKLGFHKQKIILWDGKKRKKEYWMIKPI